MENIINLSDSYKWSHHLQYPKNTEYVYSYFESRKGSKWDSVLFFGLQAIIKKYLEGVVITKEKINIAEKIAAIHFGDSSIFCRERWDYILEKYSGRLPIKIKAIPEGLVVPVSNVLLTVENTDPKCAWLTNHLESLISHVWFSSTVSTLSFEVKKMLKSYLNVTCEDGDNFGGLDFMLHDFGFRGVSSVESAGMGGMAHLVNFKGTDTIAAIDYAMEYYKANLNTLAFSVVAAEHSVMTAFGPAGELEIIKNLIKKFPSGILSVVSDSYDIDRCVDEYYGKILKDEILARPGRFVIRPDSGDPVTGILKILDSVYKNFGGFVNKKGFKVINQKIGILWGDGLDIEKINEILDALVVNGWSVECVYPYGMGGGLLQKINRDTMRFAFKSSAQCRNGIWYDIYKDPKDKTKASKRGRLKLIKTSEGFKTVSESSEGVDILEVVFENGKLIRDMTFDQVRENSTK